MFQLFQRMDFALISRASKFVNTVGLRRWIALNALSELKRIIPVREPVRAVLIEATTRI